MIAQIIDKNNKIFVAKMLDDIINKIHMHGPIDSSDFEKLALIKQFHPDIFKKYENEILYVSGLFYKVNQPKNLLEEVYSIFSDSIYDDTGKRFTPVQADAYNSIKEKKFFSFSAPTSAGKSFLFRELIVNNDSDIVIVVPSRALIAEYLSIVKSLVDNSVLVLQFIENINIAKTKRRVFIITPERGNELFQHKIEFDISLFLFDEAQLSEEEIRGIRFDSFVRRVSREFPSATKVFAHPFVKNPEAQLTKHDLLSSDSVSALYNQNAVGKIFIGVDKDNMFYFSPYEDKGKERVPVNDNIVEDIMRRNGTILIYTSKNKLYSKQYLRDYSQYLRFCNKLTNPHALKYVEQLRDYIGANNKSNEKFSLVVNLMERGIVIHHGSMPLKMRMIIEDFVRNNYAKICFATSTLKQGINMPFDMVFIDNYTKMDVLTLKNLIGRSGRSTNTYNKFDYGYTIIDKVHIASFCKRINEWYSLKDTSLLDAKAKDVQEDNVDLVEAIKTDNFDDETHLTNNQLQRIKNSDLDVDIEYILEHLLIDGEVLNGKDYYEKLTDKDRKKVKDAFKKIYIAHLYRNSLTAVEQSILSTAIPILLWHIQGKTFKEVLALRYSYLTQRSNRLKIKAQAREGEISELEADNKIKNLKVRFSQAPSSLPNKNAKKYTDFSNTYIENLDYDTLVFDTYDYIDKVISLSLADPLCAAFKVYYEKTGDARANDMINYIRYGTNNDKEIWLLRYGFAFEDISWLKAYIIDIDENSISFSDAILNLDDEKKEIIRRYI